MAAQYSTVWMHQIMKLFPCWQTYSLFSPLADCSDQIVNNIHRFLSFFLQAARPVLPTILIVKSLGWVRGTKSDRPLEVKVLVRECLVCLDYAQKSVSNIVGTQWAPVEWMDGWNHIHGRHLLGLPCPLNITITDFRASLDTLLWGAILNIVACLAASLPLPTRCQEHNPVVASKNVSKNCQIVPGGNLLPLIFNMDCFV